MITVLRALGLSLVFVLQAPLFAQPAPIPEPTANPMPSVAATVNGQPIHETAVERALQSVPQDERPKARGETLEFLVNNTIVDQYLNAIKVVVEPKDVDQHLANFKKEIRDHEQDYALLLRRMKLTEDELREQIHQLLRWEKFVNQQATDEKLKALFQHMPEAFDGSTIRARHLLLAPGDESTAKLRAWKARMEKDVADGLARLPADTDNVTRERKRQELLETAFAVIAQTHSTCNSRAEGGLLPPFPRYGAMTETFAKAAYGLRPFELSDVISTPFGVHLILVTGRKPGMPTTLDDPKVKDAVKEVYESKLKDAIIDQMKPRAKIEIIQKN
jgi:peptidyl-prolyl cis-trans isomerase C